MLDNERDAIAIFNGVCFACGVRRRIARFEHVIANRFCYDEFCTWCGTKRPFGNAQGPKKHCLIIGKPGHPHWLPLHEAAEKAGFSVYSANNEKPPSIYCNDEWLDLAHEICAEVGASPYVPVAMPRIFRGKPH